MYYRDIFITLMTSNGPSTSQPENIMGRTDILFRFLQLIHRETPWAIDEYLVDLDFNCGHRPVAEQIADRILVGNEEYYDLYRRAQREVGAEDPYSPDEQSEQLGGEELVLVRFLEKWASLERGLASTVVETVKPQCKYANPVSTALEQVPWIPEDTRLQTIYLKTLRDRVIHASDDPPCEFEVSEGIRVMENTVSSIHEAAPDELKEYFTLASPSRQ